MNKNVVILGCPRSGTSLVAQLVKSAGFDADGNGTKQLMRSNPKYNPEGYFERIDIVKLNDSLLKEINSSYSFLNPPTLKEMEGFTTNNEVLINTSNELNSYNNWFIKDSRLCFTLHLYNLKDISIVKVKRNPSDVKLSMVNHYGNLFEQDVTHGPHNISQVDFDSYYTHINQCIDWQSSTRNLDIIEVNYEDVMSGNVENLNTFLGSDVDPSLIKPKHRNYGV